jgi:hypothetical protein
MAYGPVAAVNPPLAFTVLVSMPATTNPDGSRSPAYAAPVTTTGDIQAQSAGDIRHTDGLNIQGVQRSIYLSGRINGLVRPDRKGGDIVIDGCGKVWLVNQVIEYWPDWVKVSVTLQNSSPADFGLAI